MIRQSNLIFLLLLLCIAYNSNAQDKIKERIETIRQFTNDLRNGESNDEIFRKYLVSRGGFLNDTVRRTAIGATDLLRKSLLSLKSTDVEVYKYTDNPETARKLKSTEDPNSSIGEQLPLEFGLDVGHSKSSGVQMDDLYVLKMPGERFFVLFGEGKKMVTYFGLQWGHRVALVEF